MREDYLEKLAGELSIRGLDGMLIAPSQDLRFLLGFVPMLCLRFQGLLVTSRGEYCYICNVLTADEIQPHLQGRPVFSWHDNDGCVDAVRKAFSEYGLLGKKVGVNNAVRAFHVLELSRHLDVTFVNAADLCAEVRIFKDDAELKAMRTAAAIGVEGLKRTVPHIRAGMLEKEVQQILEENLLALGAEYASALVASGPNSGFPHYNANSRQLRHGDTLLIDFGCLYNGLCSDITRTFFIGEASEEQLRIYELVRAANEAAISALEKGERWIPNIDRAAREVIENGGYGAYFTTRLGHGLGYMPHEAPDIRANHERELAARMAFTIEPGIYRKNFGVRIEDCLILEPNGTPTVLSEGFPKECMIIGEEGDGSV